jgi:hypothetical protein
MDSGVEICGLECMENTKNSSLYSSGNANLSSFLHHWVAIAVICIYRSLLMGACILPIKWLGQHGDASRVVGLGPESRHPLVGTAAAEDLITWAERAWVVACLEARARGRRSRAPPRRKGGYLRSQNSNSKAKSQYYFSFFFNYKVRLFWVAQEEFLCRI